MRSRAAEIIFFTVWTAITVLVSYWLSQQSASWMPPEATQEAEAVDSLFAFLVGLGSAVFLGVFGMITHAVIHHRAERGDFTEGHAARGNGKLEVLWTAIPTVLAIWIAIQGYNIYALLDIEGQNAFAEMPAELLTEPQVAYVADISDSPDGSLDRSEQNRSGAARSAAVRAKTVEVVAKQWAWSFYYPEQDLTTSELHLPINQPAKLVLASEDVLHGFYVPAFRIKQDIIPGQKINLVISPKLAGKYRLHDSQFSGTYFSLMEADVYVDTPEDFQQWLSVAALHPKGDSGNSSNHNLAAAEYADPPNLWGQRWAINAPDAFLKAASNTAPNITLKATAKKSTAPNL